MPFKKGHTPWSKGKRFTQEHRNKLSESRKKNGNIPPNRKGSKMSKEARIKIGLAGIGRHQSPESIEKGAIKRRGKLNWNWKGGITPERKKLYFTPEYKLWRKSVFERDNYTCIWCGQKGGYLNADHIKPWALFPELRFAIDNGRTLCLSCHKKTDTWGGRSQRKKAEWSNIDQAPPFN